jgi:hypothetical protein
MKIRFILLLLISALSLRCATFVHGRQVILLPDKEAVNTILKDQPSLPAGLRTLLASPKKSKTHPAHALQGMNMEAMSFECHAHRHPVRLPAMHANRNPSIGFSLLPSNAALGKCKLIVVERVMPNNKGSPEAANNTTPASAHFQHQQSQTNDRHFYTCFPFTSTGYCLPIIRQAYLPIRCSLFVLPNNGILSPGGPSGTPNSHLLSFPAFQLIAQPIDIGCLYSYVHRRYTFYLAYSADYIPGHLAQFFKISKTTCL